MLMIQRLLIFYGIIFCVEGTRTCPEATKPHLTRCDIYYRCKVLESEKIVWLTQNCPNGLIYHSIYGNCVLPDDDWDCQLDTESRSSSSSLSLNADDDNVYGVNNLSYLKEQIKGYISDDNTDTFDGEEVLSDEDANEDVLITMSNNGTLSFESIAYASNSSGNEIESSGDGDGGNDEDLQNKSSYIPIPNNSDGIILSQLQRLSQLVQKINNNEHAELTPDDLNQYLSLHKLIHQKYSSNTNAEPVPHNKLIKDHHLKQILDLQKKLNNFAAMYNAYSTPSTPVKFTVTGNGIYPANATSVHIKATNALKMQHFPETGYSTSQIVVNRPGGSVVFRLPYSDYQQKKKPEKENGQISEETLKKLLELTKNMANQASNTPNFVHSLPSSSNSYVQPIIQPVLYNIPWDQLSLSNLFDVLGTKKIDNVQSDKESMEKISSVKISVPTTLNESDEPNDNGPTTIIHNHVPITIAQPSPTNSIVNRIQQTVSTTARPVTDDQYNSYGNNIVKHSQYYQNDQLIKENPSNTMVSIGVSPFSTQQTSYNTNVEQPQYIQIAQSRPDHFVPVFANSAVVSNALRPIPTFASVDGGYTQKFLTTYTPQPHLGDNNVNEIVHINRKPYPTLPPLNYVPIATVSSSTPNYADPSDSYGYEQKYPQIADKIDHFIESNEPNDNEDDIGVNSTNDRYKNNDNNLNSNVEQVNTENVMDLLANYNSRIKSNSMESIIGMGSDTQNIGIVKSSTNNIKSIQIQGNHKQFVNFNGNFMSLETYQKTIEPYIQKNSMIESKIELLTCATGVRQANRTDCTRYFVCNEKTGKILSYSCPPYTAFNSDTKICNADTYSKCIDNESNQINSKLSMKMSLNEAHRIKAEAVKAQQLANLIKLETDKILSDAHQVRYKQSQMTFNGKSTPFMISTTTTTTTRPFKIVQKQPYRKPQINQTSFIIPQKQNNKNVQSNKKLHGKRKIPCRKEGKLVDNLSQHHYFLCFKDQTQTMRARRLQCPAKLTFCPNTLVCNAIDKCPSYRQ